jgi:superfamily II DNA or RNA helicase
MLHAFQIELVERVGSAYGNGARCVVMQLATGGGKTHVAADLVRRSVGKGNRVIFAAHLDALIDDTSDRLATVGIAHGIVQADRPTNPDAPVQVCSLATLHRRGERPPADFLIVDECHRAMASTVREVLDAYPRAKLLGLSATPERADAQPLGAVFDRMISGPSVQWLTTNAYLVQAVVLSPPALTPGALALDPVDAYVRHVPGLPAMIFARDAEHATDVQTRLDAANIPTALVLGDTPRRDRRQARDRLAAGEPLVLVGCGVFVEGWDSPEVRAIILARAFGVVGGFLQACGRGLRRAVGKTTCTIVDLSGAAILHGLPADDRVWSLTAGVRRTGEALDPLIRCADCLAVFHTGPAQCPRCGATMRSVRRLPRRATRIERQELARLDTRPQSERDAMAVRGIEKQLLASGRFPIHRIGEIARSVFARSKRRTPAAGAA